MTIEKFDAERAKGNWQRSRLFVAQLVCAMTEFWFDDEWDEDLSTREEVKYFIDCYLVAAADAEDAYRIVSEIVRSNSDSNHDGPGDLTEYSCLGINEIEELTETVDDLPAHLRAGVIPTSVIYFSEVDSAGRPNVREKEELDIFRRAAD